jgi:hypothetical protein
MSSSVALGLTLLAGVLATLLAWKRFRERRLPGDRPLERARGVMVAMFRGVARGSRPWLETLSCIAAVCLLLIPELVRIVRGEAVTSIGAALMLLLAVPIWLRAGALWRTRSRPGAPVREALLLAALAAVWVVSACVPALWSLAPQFPVVGFSAGLALAGLLLAGGVIDPLGRLLHVWSRKLEEQVELDPHFAPSSALLARTEELKERFLRERRLVIDDLLDDQVARTVAEALRAYPLKRVRRGPASRGAAAATSVLTAAFTPHRPCNGACKPLCALANSLVAGSLRDFMRQISGRPALLERSGEGLEPVATINGWDAGSFVAPHADVVGSYDDAAIVFVWHASENWDPSWGGVLRFTATPEQSELIPRFNTLHLWAISPEAVHEVTRVTGPEIRYTLTGRLHEPLEGFAPRARSASVREGMP